MTSFDAFGVEVWTAKTPQKEKEEGFNWNSQTRPIL